MRLLDCAGELLSEHGAKALSLRKLAAEVNTSTTAVYSLFGGKPGLVRELYIEAFRRFGGRLRLAERSGKAAEDLIVLGMAYRAAALADPHLYSIMFTKVVPGFDPDDEAKAHGLAALEPLLDVIRAGIADGTFTDTEPETIALASWGIAHGLVSLEINGNMPDIMDVAPVYERSLRAAAVGWLR